MNDTVNEKPRRKGRGPNRKPSILQRRAIQAVMTGEAKSVAQAMRIAGYSESTARHYPKVVTNSQAWKDTIEKYGITVDSIARRHAKLLDSNREEIAIKAVEMGYKVHGVYEKASGTNFNAPVLIQITPPPNRKDPAIAPHSGEGGA